MHHHHHQAALLVGNGTGLYRIGHTAIGLAAAIPAVMLYNKFSRDIGTFAGRLEDFAAEFAVVMSRELDRREVA